MELKDREYNVIRKYAYDNFGISLNDDKKSLVYSRFRSLLIEMKMSSFEEYYEYLIKDKTGKAASDFINRISTNHTFFMREREHFDYFYNTVLPFVEKKYKNEKDIRVWCAASSSGEEAYTLQILLKEYFSGKSGWNTQILATDISTEVLTMAYRGIYSKQSLKTMPNDWVKKYFEEYDDEYMQVLDKIKKDVIFRKVNLVDTNLEKRFTKKFQAIFCRNVMIYFNDTTRTTLVNKLYDMLDDEGYLFVGHSESLNYSKSKFKYVTPAVYRK